MTDEMYRMANALENTPGFLERLLSESPVELVTRRRRPGGWTIHEHTVHVCVGEKYAFHSRYQAFLTETYPVFDPVSGDDFPDGFYASLNLAEAVSEFRQLRSRTLELIRGSDDGIWSKKAHHPEYTIYTPFIMVRHLLLHDYWHMYAIEELILTRDAVL